MNKLVVVCAVSAFLSAVGQTPAALADSSRLAPQALDGAEDRLLADAVDGRLDHLSLFDAAVIASGVPDVETAAKCRSRFGQFRASVASAVKAKGSVGGRAKEIFRRMHQEFLTGQYRAACTELHRTLDNGHYNCVTATILYRCLCAEFGVPVKTIAETGHVYCLLEGDEPVTIQTTSPDGFTTSDTTDDGREITDVQLLAKIYYNRGLSLLEQDQFQRAFDLLQLGYRLDPQDQIAWRNILACVNNWALSECDAGRFQHAAELLLRGLEMAPDYRPFLDNELHVHHRWVSRLCIDGRFKQALDILESGHRRRPDAPLFDDGRLAVYEVWKNALRASGKTDQAADVWPRPADR
jgi:hypothetical protein